MIPIFTQYTLQDLREACEQGQKEQFLLEAMDAYRGSRDHTRAREAMEYFMGRNIAIMNKYILKAEVETVKDAYGRERRAARTVRVEGNRLPCGFFRRAVMQLSQYLLSGGVILPEEKHKKALGPGFDKALEQAGELALVQGVCWVEVRDGHTQVIPAAEGRLCGFFPLYDEMTGRLGAGARFWQLNENKRLHLQLFEQDAVSLYRLEDSGLHLLRREGCRGLCVFPLYANNERESELTEPIRRKIDAYDSILSDLGNNLDRANEVYWVLNNFGGQTQQALEVVEEINRLKTVINRSDGQGGATADVKCVEVPWQARKTALDILRRELYSDFMALDMDALKGGSLTNVAIRTAAADLDLKANAFEWQCFCFVQSVLEHLGIRSENISFRRQCISNAHETLQDICLMRGDIDRACALRLNPYIDQDEALRLSKKEREEHK